VQYASARCGSRRMASLQSAIALSKSPFMPWESHRQQYASAIIGSSCMALLTVGDGLVEFAFSQVSLAPLEYG